MSSAQRRNYVFRKAVLQFLADWQISYIHKDLIENIKGVL